jgi:hypothetical protein
MVHGSWFIVQMARSSDRIYLEGNAAFVTRAIISAINSVGEKSTQSDNLAFV